MRWFNCDWGSQNFKTEIIILWYCTSSKLFLVSVSKNENCENVFPFSFSRFSRKTARIFYLYPRKPRKRFPVFAFLKETVFVFSSTKTTKTFSRFRKFLKSVFAFSRFRILFDFCVFVFVFCTKTKRKTKTFSRFRFSLPTSGWNKVNLRGIYWRKNGCGISTVSFSTFRIKRVFNVKCEWARQIVGEIKHLWLPRVTQ